MGSYEVGYWIFVVLVGMAIAVQFASDEANTGQSINLTEFPPGLSEVSTDRALPLAAYSAAQHQPLFNVERTPMRIAVSYTPVGGANGDLSAVGWQVTALVVSTHDDSFAILEKAGGGNAVKVSISENLEGWTFLAIDKEKATFVKNGRESEMKLRPENRRPPVRPGRPNYRPAGG